MYDSAFYNLSEQILVEFLAFNTPNKSLFSVFFMFRIIFLKQKLPKGDELPIMVALTGGSGPARVWGHVKSRYSAEELLKGLRV
jgi:hypothetical protein